MPVTVDVQKCTGCGDCVELCPTEALSIENEKCTVNDDCADCGSCVDECPAEALALD